MNKLWSRVICIVLLLILPLNINSTKAQDVFVEEGSIAVVEIESAPIKSGWRQGRAAVGGKSVTYYASKADYFNTPNLYTLTYKIQINNPSTYLFKWHCKVGEGSSPTDFNDSWLKLPDANDFYAKSPSGNVVRPKGFCTNDCPNGSGSGGWFKVYSNGTVNWTWRTRTSDNDPHDIFAKFESVGMYTIEISARSKKHFLNRFVMYKPDVHSESYAAYLSRPENSKLVETSVSSPVQSSLCGISKPGKQLFIFFGR